jgi:hypothetical protein
MLDVFCGQFVHFCSFWFILFGFGITYTRKSLSTLYPFERLETVKELRKGVSVQPVQDTILGEAHNIKQKPYLTASCRLCGDIQSFSMATKKK